MVNPTRLHQLMLLRPSQSKPHSRTLTRAVGNSSSGAARVKVMTRRRDSPPAWQSLASLTGARTARAIHVTNRRIIFWANEMGGGYDDLPESIHESRNTLHVDLPVDNEEVSND